MPSLKFNPIKVNTYSELAVNKYKEGSLLDSSIMKPREEKTGAGTISTTPSGMRLPYQTRLPRTMESLSRSFQVKAAGKTLPTTKHSYPL